MAKTKKKTVTVSSFLRDAANARLDDAAASMKYPTLMECLLPVYEGSTLIRQAGKLSIQPEGAHWRLKLDCPTEILSMTLALPSLVECLEAVEGHLNSGNAIWSPGWKKNKVKLPTIDDIIQ
jgi:hypothetical protein